MTADYLREFIKASEDLEAATTVLSDIQFYAERGEAELVVARLAELHALVAPHANAMDEMRSDDDLILSAHLPVKCYGIGGQQTFCSAHEAVAFYASAAALLLSRLEMIDATNADQWRADANGILADFALLTSAEASDLRAHIALERARRCEREGKRPEPLKPKEQVPPPKLPCLADRINVDLEQMTCTIDGTKIEAKQSPLALRVFKILVAADGKPIHGHAIWEHDPDGVIKADTEIRPDKLKQKLPWQAKRLFMATKKSGHWLAFPPPTT